MTGPPRGVWLGATRVLHRPVPVREPYPHLCGAAIPPKYVHRLTRRNCAACGDKQQAPVTGNLRPHPHTTGCCPLPWQHQIHRMPEPTAEQRDTERRMTGERE